MARLRQLQPKVQEMKSAFDAYYGENFVMTTSDFIMVHFPQKRVSLNSDRTKFTDITDLYVKIKFILRDDGNVTIDRIQGDVGSYSALQYHNSYRHSHLHIGCEEKNFGDFCLGDSELSSFKVRSRTVSYDYDAFYLMANMIDTFMSCEGPSPYTTVVRANSTPSGNSPRANFSLQDATRVILDMGFIPDFSYSRGTEIISPCTSEEYLFEFAKRIPKHFLGVYDTEKGYADEYVHQNNNDAFLMTLRTGTLGRSIMFRRENRPIVIHAPQLSDDPLRVDRESMLDYPTPRVISVINQAIVNIYKENLKRIQPKTSTLNSYSVKKPIADKMILNHILTKYQ